MKKTLVFGGWAVPPVILKDFFCDDNVDYVDVNKIMPKLFCRDHQLKSDWPRIVINEYGLTDGNLYDVIAGWSTGAMFAYAAARLCNPKELTLLSATPCFCRKDDFRFGTRVSIIDQMINTSAVDKDTVLKSFYERSGIGYDQYQTFIINNYTVHELVCGLNFLKQADLRPVVPLSIPVKFYHGRNDPIIPIAASKYFCEQTGGEHVEVDGAHAFFLRM